MAARLFHCFAGPRPTESTAQRPWIALFPGFPG
jgi:hypothetical protein